jgi:rhodanese-related sulfurtransferase
VVLVCASGGRSARAAQMLSEQGVRAVNVLGGTNAWVAAGLAVER